jgi:hypothetical protein
MWRAAILCGLIVGPCAWSSAITLDDLRETLAESRASVTTARVVYVEQWTDNAPSEGDPTTVEYKVNESRRSTLVEASLLVDTSARRAKSVLRDLRDVNELLGEYGLPDDDVVRHNVARMQTFLYKDDYAMLFDARIPLLHFWKPGVLPEHSFKFARLGVASEALLADEYAPQLAEMTEEGKTLLRLTATRQRPSGTVETVIQCDPALGYRFRASRTTCNGSIISEVVAADYRDVNGIPYPFSYVERTFYSDGSVRTERQYAIQEVQLGLLLANADFKVNVPSGTEFTDAAASGICSRIGMARPFGIDDALRFSSQMSRERRDTQPTD